jgi:integrase
MPRKKNTVPKYSLHKSTGQAFIRVPDGKGGQEFVYLGKHGTDESREEYERKLAEMRLGREAGRVERHSPVLVNQVLVAFFRHAEAIYVRPDGTNTPEVAEFKRIGGVVRRLYGNTPAAKFGPLALKAVRDRFVASGCSRKVVNGRVNRVRHIFKWAAGEELIPGSVWQDLRAVDGLRFGRTEAPETDPVAPVPAWVVRATFPYLSCTVAAMVNLQMLTGMRPGEVVRIRPEEIATDGPVWVYRPCLHKMSHKRKVRAVALGPRAQALLKRYWPAASEPFFRPSLVVEQFHSVRSAGRKTPRWASHMARNARVRAEGTPVERLEDRYDVASYRRAITRGVERANRELVEAGVEIELHVPHWHPNQLRHLHATEVRRRFGLEAAQVALGHERADTTQIYAERNLDLAVKVAAELG